MKTGRNLNEVLQELVRQEEAKRDFISPAAGFHLQEDGQTFEMNHMTTEAQEVMTTSDLFHRQVASALNIPQKYYDAMKREHPELLANNVNTWFADKDNSYMVRSLDYGDGRVARAMLSARYRRIDNLEIANAVLPLFAGQEGMEVMSCEVTENRLYLKIVNHRIEKACVGDRVQAGVVISNSEVGLGSVSVQPMVYTLACTNGMIVNSLGERKKHIGRASKALDDGFDILTDETIQAEDHAFMLKLRDVTMSAIDEARFGMIVDNLEKTADMKISGKVPEVVELTGKSFGLSQSEGEGVLDYLIRGGDLSLYGLSNAVTEFSQTVDSYDRATELERTGGQIAFMDDSMWNRINAAASV